MRKHTHEDEHEHGHEADHAGACFVCRAARDAPEPLNNLLYANGLSVRHVLVDGRLQVANGRFVAADLGLIAAEAGRTVEKLWRMLEAQGFFG